MDWSSPLVWTVVALVFLAGEVIGFGIAALFAGAGRASRLEEIEEMNIEVQK